MCTSVGTKQIPQSTVCMYVRSLSSFGFQDVTPESFEEKPIIFGDFIKMGASKEDKMYENLADMKKVNHVLNEVCTLYSTHCMYVCTCLFWHPHGHKRFTFTHTRTHTHIHIHKHMRAQAHTYTHVHTHTRTYCHIRVLHHHVLFIYTEHFVHDIVFG